MAFLRDSGGEHSLCSQKAFERREAGGTTTEQAAWSGGCFRPESSISETCPRMPFLGEATSQDFSQGPYSLTDDHHPHELSLWHLAVKF